MIFGAKFKILWNAISYNHDIFRFILYEIDFFYVQFHGNLYDFGGKFEFQLLNGNFLHTRQNRIKSAK